MFPESVDRERKNMPFSMFQQQMDIAYPQATVYKRASTKYKISHRKEKYEEGGRNRIFAYKSKFLCLTKKLRESLPLKKTDRVLR